MFRRAFAALVLVAACATPAQAQWVVIDPGNLAQAILIAERTLRQYDELRRQYEIDHANGARRSEAWSATASRDRS